VHGGSSSGAAGSQLESRAFELVTGNVSVVSLDLPTLSKAKSHLHEPISYKFSTLSVESALWLLTSRSRLLNRCRRKTGLSEAETASPAPPDGHPAERLLSSTLSAARDVIAARVEVRGIDPEKQNPDRHRPIGVL